MDRKRRKKTSNEDWQSPSDGDAEITKLKDGRTALAYKAENAVDMETGAVVAVTTHGGAVADTATVEATVIEAGVAVAGLIATETPEGKQEVHPGGVREVVADKGYHSNSVAVDFSELQVRTYIAGTGTGSAQLGGPTSGEGSRVRQPAAHPGRTAANGSSGSAERRSNATSRISSIPVVWTGSMSGASRMSTRNCSYKPRRAIWHCSCGLCTEPASPERLMTG